MKRRKLFLRKQESGIAAQELSTKLQKNCKIDAMSTSTAVMAVFLFLGITYTLALAPSELIKEL